MIYALIIMAFFTAMAVIFYFYAQEKARNDIIIFATFAVFGMILAGLMAEATASEIQPYIGAEFGIDWPHDTEKKSPQCLNDGGFTSDGRLFAGAEVQRGAVVFYGELDGWRHKSCALELDDQVYDAFGFKFGFKIEL